MTLKVGDIVCPLDGSRRLTKSHGKITKIDEQRRRVIVHTHDGGYIERGINTVSRLEIEELI